MEWWTSSTSSPTTSPPSSPHGLGLHRPQSRGSTCCDDQEHPDYFFSISIPPMAPNFRRVLRSLAPSTKSLVRSDLNVFFEDLGATWLSPLLARRARLHLRTVAHVWRKSSPSLFPPSIPDSLPTTHCGQAPSWAGADRRHPKLSGQTARRSLYPSAPFPRRPVSTPVEIKELRPNLKPESLNIKTGPHSAQSVRAICCLSFWQSRQRIENAVERLGAAAVQSRVNPRRKTTTTVSLPAHFSSPRQR